MNTMRQGRQAIVSASKSSGAIDEVMGMLRDLRKKYLKN
jgi:hypothetical protein